MNLGLSKTSQYKRFPPVSASQTPTPTTVSPEAFNPEKKFRKEYVVPIRVIAEKLFELGPNPLIQQVIDVVLENYQLAHITVEEDKRLNDKDAPYGNLQYRMPDGYYDPSSELYQDKRARYKVAGINIFKQ